MRIYYTNETIGEYILRLATKVFAWYSILVLLALCISMGMQIQKINSYQANLNDEVYEQRMTVKEQFIMDIKNLPVPEETLKETTEIVEEKVVNINQTEEKQKNQTTVATSKISYKQSDVELLARLMYAEEGIFIYKLSEEEAKYVCQLAGSVVIHRKNMKYGGAKTIEEVIYAHGQYECVNNGSINQEVPDIVYEWAEELLLNGPIGPENMIYQAQFQQGSETYDIIGNQYFCLK